MLNDDNGVYMLTTVDNPFNPFDQFEEWYQFDVANGYNTCSYLARLANTSYSLSEALNEQEIDKVMDEIIEFNGKMYKKIKKGEKINPSSLQSFENNKNDE